MGSFFIYKFFSKKSSVNFLLIPLFLRPKIQYMLIRDIKKIFIDLRTKKRISQHIINQNDVITDEDIRNINTNFEELKIAELTADTNTSISKSRTSLSQ